MSQGEAVFVMVLLGVAAAFIGAAPNMPRRARIAFFVLATMMLAPLLAMVWIKGVMG